MKFGSLFSGIGGLDLGFERAGMKCAWQCEIDPSARDVLKKHFSVEVYEDVRNIGKDAGTVDLICGGFPCQDVSIAGKRAGLTGERSGLWFEFARIVDELEPQWVVVENVPGLLSSNKGRDFAVIVQWLAERGYGVAWRVLDAQYFGVPQRRRRMFIVASLGSGRAAEVLFERESRAGDIATGREAGKDVAYSLRANPSRSGGKGDGGINTTMVINLANSGANQNNVKEIDTANTQDTWGTQAVAFTPRRTEFDGMVEVSPTLNAGSGGFCAPAVAKVITTREAQSLDFETMNFVWHNHQQDGSIRIQGDTVPTVSKQWGTGGNNVPFVGVRRLTPVECERLQGIPDGWTDGQSDTARYKQLGNAVAVPVAEWIGRRIVTLPAVVSG